MEINFEIATKALEYIRRHPNTLWGKERNLKFKQMSDLHGRPMVEFENAKALDLSNFMELSGITLQDIGISST